MDVNDIIKPENLVYKKPVLMNDNHMHYCPGCSHGVVHKLIAELLEEMGVAEKAVEMARKRGLKIGILRPITLWPFPKAEVARLSKQVKGILVPELNAGQMIEDVRLASCGNVRVEHFGRLGGIVPSPDEILDAFEKMFLTK